MKELVTMWKYSTMVALTVLSAGIYMLFLLPFKGIPLIPGVTELRPATVLPVIFGLVFGPAGAWGAAFGNLAGDLFGTLNPASVFGFFGNLIYAYIPYKLWGKFRLRSVKTRMGLNGRSSGFEGFDTPNINSSLKLVEYGFVSITASVACAVFISWGADILKVAPFIKLMEIITMNNIAVNLILGPILLPIVNRICKKSGVFWTMIMHPSDITPSGGKKIPARMIVAGTYGSLLVSVVLYLITTSININGLFPLERGSINIWVDLGTIPFIGLLLYGVYDA